MTDLTVLAVKGFEGRAACTYAPPGQGVCTEPAVAHVLMSIRPLAAACMCREHWAELATNIRWIDFHAFGPACNLPGSNWMPSTHEARGTCVLPYDLTEDVETYANETESAHA